MSDTDIGCVVCHQKVRRNRDLCITCYNRVRNLAKVVGWDCCEDLGLCGSAKEKRLPWYKKGACASSAKR